MQGLEQERGGEGAQSGLCFIKLPLAAGSMWIRSLLEAGALGYQDRGLEWGKRVGVSRVEVHDGGGRERIQEEAQS